MLIWSVGHSEKCCLTCLKLFRSFTSQWHCYIFTRGQFWHPGTVFTCVCPSVHHQVCPHDNSSPVQARLAKFGPKMQNTLVTVLVVLGGNRPWPSRSNSTSKLKFTPFWACSTITHHSFKLGSPNLAQRCKIHWLRSLLFWGFFWCNWPWPSRLNCT